MLHMRMTRLKIVDNTHILTIFAVFVPKISDNIGI